MAYGGVIIHDEEPGHTISLLVPVRPLNTGFPVGTKSGDVPGAACRVPPRVLILTSFYTILLSTLNCRPLTSLASYGEAGLQELSTPFRSITVWTELKSFDIPSALLTTRSTPIAAASSLPIESSKSVNRIIRVLGSRRLKIEAASGPPNFGMQTSRRIKSGINCFARSMACKPSSASPQISYPWCSSSVRRTWRVVGLSSTMSSLGTLYSN